jgi:poly-beta-1,6-N-acetyl-D-glucosamine synthase
VLVQIIFWLAVSVPLYAYIGYPLLLLALGCLIRREVKKAPILPFVSLLIPAYNEAGAIARKVANSLALDYPADCLEIVISSDGSSDATVAIAQTFLIPGRVRVIAFPDNRGKVATLNASVPQLRGEIVAFSDASALLEENALRRLVENFADPEVGAVSGVYKIVRPEEVSIGPSEDLYWKYETSLKLRESKLASTLGGHGQLHAIRRSLYSYPPAGVINDDYIIPLSVIAKGYRAVYETAAVVYEEAREMTGFPRRIRIMASNIQQLTAIGDLLFPPRPLELLFFVSHKLARLLVPFAMVTALAVNVLLPPSLTYTLLLAVQIVFYTLAGVGILWRLRPRILMLPFYFSMINAATFFGLYHALTRRRGLAWK